VTIDTDNVNLEFIKHFSDEVIMISSIAKLNGDVAKRLAEVRFSGRSSFK